MTNTFLQKMRLLWQEFIPLSISDVTMAFGDPMANGTVAQLPHFQTNLSAFGIIKSIVIFFESPIIMILHASTALSSYKESREALGRLVIIASILLTLILGILALPFCFFPILEGLVGIPKDVAVSAHKILLCLLLWPSAIAVRRYFQGILIIYGKRNIIAHAGFLRLFVLFLYLLVGYFCQIQGSLLAGGAFMCSVIAETIAIVYAAKKYCDPSVEIHKPTLNENVTPKTLKDVWRFYWPLAHSMVLVWGGRALLIVCLAKAIDSRSALMIWPLTWAVIVLFANASRMVQQVIIRHRDSFHPFDFIIFALSVGACLSAVLIFMCISHAGSTVLHLFAGKDPKVLEDVKNILLICASVPIFAAVQNVLQGFLMSVGNTKGINHATLWGVIALLMCAGIGVKFHFFGARIAAISTQIAFIVEILLLSHKAPWKIYIDNYLQQKKIQEGV